MSIETSKATWNIAAVQAYVEKYFRHLLLSDISTYATGRQRLWLGEEPSLSARGPSGASCNNEKAMEFRNRAKTLLGFNFDYLLLTFSGTEAPVGIELHRDAGSLSYEAYGVNISGTCKFTYHEQRRGFGPGAAQTTVIHEVMMEPGSIVRFNSKNPHSAEPSINRWAFNAWKKK